MSCDNTDCYLQIEKIRMSTQSEFFLFFIFIFFIASNTHTEKK